MAESFELQDMLERPQKAVPLTPAIDSDDDADGTITAWSLAAFASSVPPLGVLWLTAHMSHALGCSFSLDYS